MAKKLAFILELENGAKLVSQVSDIELRYKALGQELRTTEKAILEFENASAKEQEALKATGVDIDKLNTKYKVLKAEQIDLRESKKKLNQDIRDQVKLFNDLGERVPEDSLLGLRRQYRGLRKEIDQMDTAARKSAQGLEKIAQAKGIKEQINEIGKSVGDFREQVGSYEKAVTSVFEKFGIGKGGGGGISKLAEPVLGLLGGGFPFGGGGVLDFLGPVGSDGLPQGKGADQGGGAIGELVGALGPQGLLATAGAATLIATADYVADITQEFEKLFQKVGQVTNIVGPELVGATAQIKAISDTYQVEFDEVLKAANATSKAFNSDIGDTLSLIQQGLAAGANFNDEYLDSLREYPRLVAEAGLSQEQFNEILIRSTQEGIYSDKGIDTVKEGNIRLREQTKATRKALTDAFGKEATDELLDGINTGAITTFEAIQEVSKGLTETQLTAEQTGAVLADVFGGPGEDAGLEFVKILQDVDGNLQDVINTSDVYSKIQQAQFDANLRLSTSQANIASQFAGSGTSLRTLGTEVKAFGSEVLDGLLLKVRTVGTEFSEGGFLRGLKQLASLNSAVPIITQAEVNQRLSDQEALRELNEGQAKAEEDRIARNKRGANGVKGLREEQAKLAAAIQDAKVKGEPYADLLEEYNSITEKLAAATDVLSKSVERGRKARDGEIGSIKDLKAQLSELNTEIEEAASPSQEILRRRDNLIEEIAAKEKAINAQTKDGKIKAAKEEIDILRDSAELQARLTIDNQKLLQEELKKIKVESEIAFLNEQLELEKNNAKAKEEIERDLQLKRLELQGINTNVSNINADVDLNSAVTTAQNIANAVSQSEEELQVRLSNIQILAENNRLQRRLDNEDLAANERIALENKIQANISEIEANELQLRSDQQIEAINSRLERELLSLLEQSESLEEFEKNKTEIILNAELERLEAERERKVEAGEELLQIDREIAEKELQIQQEKNKEIIDAQKKRIEQQKKFEQDLVGIQVDAFTGLGEAIGKFFGDAEASQKDFANVILLTVLDTVEKTINLYLAQILAGEIASKSFVGIATAGILSGIVRGALGAARAAIGSNEEGGLLIAAHSKGTIMRDPFSIRSHTRDDLKRGTIFQGYSHASKGEHFSVGGRINEAEYGEAIINKKSTQRFKPILSAINAYNGWGKAFQDGVVLGDEIGNVTPVSGFGKAEVRIPESQMQAFAEIVGNKNSEALTPIVENIVLNVISGLDESNRLQERQAAAERNGAI